MNPTAFFSQAASDYHLQCCYLNLDRKPSSKINHFICLVVLSVINKGEKRNYCYPQPENYKAHAEESALQSSSLK